VIPDSVDYTCDLGIPDDRGRDAEFGRPRFVFKPKFGWKGDTKRESVSVPKDEPDIAYEESSEHPEPDLATRAVVAPEVPLASGRARFVFTAPE
jgi:hypothetical protein